jgi:hypothetical protein
MGRAQRHITEQSRCTAIRRGEYDKRFLINTNADKSEVKKKL